MLQDLIWEEEGGKRKRKKGLGTSGGLLQTAKMKNESTPYPCAILISAYYFLVVEDLFILLRASSC